MLWVAVAGSPRSSASTTTTFGEEHPAEGGEIIRTELLKNLLNQLRESEPAEHSLACEVAGRIRALATLQTNLTEAM